MPSTASRLRVAVRVGADVAHYPPAATFGPRVLRDFEFVWLLSGRARWETAGATVDLRPGSLLLARPGMEDRFTWDSRQASVHAYVHFRVLDRGELGTPDRWPLTRELGGVSPLASLCHYLLLLGSMPTASAVRRTNDVVRWLLDLFVRGPLPENHPPEMSEHMMVLVRYVRKQWRDGRTRAFTLADLATAIRVSPSHLGRLFREQWGIGPVAALELIRLARAATLLQRSNLTAAAIADVSGYANPYHFSRRFSQVYGVSPRTYRLERSGDDPLGPVARENLLPLAYAVLFESQAWDTGRWNGRGR
ncbi:MAG TPA: AraC family transcriptional regulator [Actinopolymorphaceae bacterium]